MHRIPGEVREDIVDFALEYEDLTSSELAVNYTDEKHYFVSESSAHRILRAEDLRTALIAAIAGKLERDG